jgi:hypothetical protein
LSADLLQRLMEAGTPMALIAEVAERLADAQAAERLLAKRRAADRERKAVANPRIPRNSTEDAENAEFQPKKKSPQTPKEKSPPLNGSPKGEPIPPIESPSLKPEHVVEAWNEMAERHGLPLVRRLTPERSRKLSGRLRTTSVDDWTEAISAIERSPFLRGENDRGWRADFDFLLQPASFTKLIEGSYDRTH